MVSALTVLGLLGLIGGGIGYYTFPSALSLGVKQLINLSENGMIYSTYLGKPSKGRSKYYLFEVNNPRAALRGSRMEFKLRGPYYYKTSTMRGNVSFSSSGERVKYATIKKSYANEEQSENFDEKMWLINPVIPTVYMKVRSIIVDRLPFQRFSEPLVFKGLNMMLDNYKERLIVRTTPRAFLNGRRVEMFEQLTDYASKFNLLALFSSSDISKRKGKNFMIGFVQNKTGDSLEVYTGVKQSREKYAEVVTWKDKNKLDVWQGKCNTISGTNGELYKPNVNVSSPIRIFFSSLCRSSSLVPVSSEPVKTNGTLLAWQFELDPKLYSGVRKTPQNRCFCIDERTFDCQYNGLMPMGPCFSGAPLYFAKPQFAGADKQIKNTVKFIESNTTDLPTEQIIALDQITGTVLKVELHLMAVIKIVRQVSMRDIGKVQNLTYAPVFATGESIELPAKSLYPIYIMQQMNLYYKHATLGTAAAGGALLVVKLLFF